MEQNTFEQEKKLLCLKYKVNFYLTVFLLHTNHSEGGYLFSQYIELLKNNYNFNTEQPFDFDNFKYNINDFIRDRDTNNINKKSIDDILFLYLFNLRNVNLLNDLLDFLITNTTDKPFLKFRVDELENKIIELEKSKVKVKKNK